MDKVLVVQINECLILSSSHEVFRLLSEVHASLLECLALAFLILLLGNLHLTLHVQNIVNGHFLQRQVLLILCVLFHKDITDYPW